MKVFSAEPSRTVSFAPGQDDPVVTRPGRKVRHAKAGEVLRGNDLTHAPIEKFSTQFLETMRTKGWLKDKRKQ